MGERNLEEDIFFTEKKTTAKPKSEYVEGELTKKGKSFFPKWKKNQCRYKDWREGMISIGRIKRLKGRVVYKDWRRVAKDEDELRRMKTRWEEVNRREKWMEDEVKTR